MATTNQSNVAARLYFDPAQSVLNTANATLNGSKQIERATAAAFNKYKPYLEKIQQGTSTAVTGIQAAETSINNFIDRSFATLQKELQGWSDVTAQTIGTAAGIVKNPFDINNVGNSITSLLNTVSPGFGTNLNNTLTNLNLDKVAKAPGILFSSLDHLINAADDLLAIPLSFISSIYFGALEIIKQIGKSLNNIINNFFKELLSFLDPVITGIIDLLQSIGSLAAQIQGIAAIFSGVNNVSQYALQINTITTQINSALQNPLDTIIGALPNDISKGVSQIIYDLNNPEQLINQYLPPQLSQSFAKISQITGYGFNGNMGFGFASVLQGVQGGVIRNVLTNFANQYKVLGPLIAGNSITSSSQIGGNPTLVNGYNSGLNNRNFTGPKQWIDADTGIEVRRAQAID